MQNLPNLIEIRGVSKSFGEVEALKNVSFNIGKGELTFLTGHSGAGKTTLLRLILREILPNTGEIIIEGEDIVKLPAKKVPQLRQKIGTVFQDYKLINERTVRENVEVALAVTGLPEVEWGPRVEQVLKMVQLTKKAELFPRQLSGGEMQRTSLARALVIDPMLILADEPTGNLDWETSAGIMDLLLGINKVGKTILVATHNRMLLDKYKGRVIELKEGRVFKDTQAPSTGLDARGKMKVRVQEV